MREIILTKGRVALVDDEDYEYLNQRKWHAVNAHDDFWYAMRRGSRKIKPRPGIYMHRVLVPDCPNVDHRDHDGLNNQRYNLRAATYSQNQYNKAGKSLSGYKGVYKSGKHSRWQALYNVNGKATHIGMYGSKEDAARAYNEKAIELHGEFAYLNVIPND